MQKLRPSDNLAAARSYLIEHGWARKTLQADDGRVCALGALECVGVEWDVAFETDCLQDAAIERAGAMVGSPFPIATIASFNDDFAESTSDVIAIYDRAIILAKEAEA